MVTSKKISSGVQELIDRLRRDGVDAGEREAKLIIEKARTDSARIVEEAKKEADEYKASSRAAIEREKEAAQAAVQMAVRDTLLAMRSEIAAKFAAQIRRLVSAEICSKEFLRRMILAVAGANAPDTEEGRQIELLIAEDLLSDGHGSGKEAHEQIDDLVLGISAEMLREGVQIKPAGDDKPGIRVRLAGEDVEIDLTDEAISEAMVRHLLPRFRYVVQGIQEA